MIGSGINVKDFVMYFECENCNTEGLLDAQSDDGGHMAYATCDSCNAQLEQYIWDSEEDNWEE